MASDRSTRKDKNQNIQVFVRLRPLNQRERDIKSLGVVEVSNNREVVVRQSHQTNLTKKFTFDRAFCPEAKQAEIFHEVVRPLIDEVLAGYNCTVFAYGQTGTGKTHTMIGEPPCQSDSWQNDPQAGIIPRSLSQLFDELRLSNTEYTVRVSYLELYNEELIDLLAPPNADSSKLRIYEDVSRKGANIVNGLEEIVVTNKNEVYKIMAQGAAKKRVASTNMNEQSSRSHTVFTITIHMKENSAEGEELVKIGKLNLVDLAGSENISKAGSDNPAKRERARECVNINQSLLTLGRVITALVERHPHIPYRESKLTRILQESLGGRTKTSIIATISPGHKDLEETMSTLEYAHRAKNIQNKPEVNQKLTRKAVLKEYSDEIYKLKRELAAARDKNGIYLPTETYNEMTFKEDQQNKEIQELIIKKRALEDERDKMEAIFAELNKQLEEKNQELDSTKNKLMNTKEKLSNTTNMLSTTRLHFEEQKHLVEKHRTTENKLSEQARQIMAAAEVASKHVDRLHDTIDRRRTLESTNLEITRTCHEEASKHRRQVKGKLEKYVQSSTEEVDGMQQDTDKYISSMSETQNQDKQNIEVMVQRFVDDMNELNTAVQQTMSSLATATQSQGSQLGESVRQHNESLHQAMRTFVEGVATCLQRAQDVDVTGHLGRFVQQWQADITARMTSLKRAHSQYTGLVRSEEDTRLEKSARARDAKRARVCRRNDALRGEIDELNKEKELIHERSQLQIADIENERKESELRLTQWFEEEKKRLAHSVKKKMSVIAEEQKLLEERINRRIEVQKALLEECEKEIEYADEDYEMCTKDKEDCMANVSQYSKEFDTGILSISIDIEAFNQNVVQLVERLRDNEIQAMTQAREDVKSQVDSILASEDESTKQFTAQIKATLEGVVTTNKSILDEVIHKIKASNTLTTEQLSSLSSSISSMVSSSRVFRDTLTARLQQLRHATVKLEESVTTDIRQQDELDELYLAKEYRVYCPSGNTPVRQEYSFPRQLTATSPHESILARFRAMRNTYNDEDCMVIEDESAQTSDSESSVSEDSAVVSNCTPPASVTGDPDRHHIVKCTSDSDIYKHPNAGKENTVRRAPSSCRKPSKLPAPQTKKPLLERNASQ